jgi:sulfur-oxidizing protein SoxZ
MDNLNPRIRVPRQVTRDEVFEVRTLVSHRMESGHRLDGQGAPIPRHIIRRFACLLNGREVFAADLHPAIASDPYLTFHLRAEEGGELTFVWVDDYGAERRETVPLQVV